MVQHRAVCKEASLLAAAYLSESIDPTIAWSKVPQCCESVLRVCSNSRISSDAANAHHSDAAASTTPAPLKAPGLVISMLTGYFHSMNLVQPITIVSFCQCLLSAGESLVHTIIRALAPEVFPEVWYQHQCQHELELLQAFAPFSLGV